MTLKKREVTLVNEAGKTITKTIIGRYTKKEAGEWVLHMENAKGGQYKIKGVVEVEG